MGARAEQVGVGGCPPERAHGKATSKGLGHGNSIRQKPAREGWAPTGPVAGARFKNSLKTLKSAGAKMPVLHAIHEQKQPLFIAKSAQAQQVIRRSRCDPAFSLYALHQNGNRRRRNRRLYRLQVIIRNVPKTRNQRLESFLNFLLTRRRSARQGAAMKGVNSRKNLEPAFIMPEFSGQLE